MYKIYINETPLLLTDARPATEGNWLVAPYQGKVKFLHHYIDMLEKTDRYEGVALLYPDVQQLFTDFAGLYRQISAAGGVVRNPENEILFIFRRGYWDLPKGKVEKEESIEAAALREVQEETGLASVRSGAYVTATYHTYHDHKDRRILKTTHWYEMTTEETALVPQTEEDIEQAVWLSLTEFLAEDRVVYRSIQDLLSLLES